MREGALAKASLANKQQRWYGITSRKFARRKSVNLPLTTKYNNLEHI